MKLLSIQDAVLSINHSAVCATNTNPSDGGGRDSFVSGDDLRSFFPSHLSNNADINPRQWNFIYIYGRARANGGASCNVTRGRHGASATGAARRGEANARDGQRRSLKIESICALGLEIQIRREISMAMPVLSPSSIYIIDRSIERRSPPCHRCAPSRTGWSVGQAPFDREK